MADTYTILAQSNPSATTSTDVYTVPASTATIISSIIVCNQASASGTYRLSIADAGAALAAKQYIAYDAPIRANDVHVFHLGITLAATDKVRVYCSSANFSINIFGVEKT